MQHFRSYAGLPFPANTCNFLHPLNGLEWFCLMLQPETIQHIHIHEKDDHGEKRVSEATIQEVCH